VRSTNDDEVGAKDGDDFSNEPIVDELCSET
jgi:hypothetical protein